MKCVTHARAFSRTLAHGNSKNEPKKAENERKKKRVNVERSTAATTKRSPDGLTIFRAYSPPGSILPEIRSG